VLATCVLLAAACSGGGGGTGGGAASSNRQDPGRPTVRVASFDFPESQVVAEVYATALQRQGYPVSRLLGLGSREVVEPALQAGLVDFVPEYLGSLLRFLGEADTTTEPGGSAAPSTRLAASLGTRGIEVLAVAPAEDQNGIVVSTSTAMRHNLHRISDLRPAAGSLAFGAPPECTERALCLLGLQSRYGLRFARFVPMSSREVTVQALESGEIDVALLDTTDPHLAAGTLTLLEDDRQLQPAENVVPLIRRSVHAAYGARLNSLVQAVSAKLTTAALVELNRRVELEGEPVARAAGDWLTAQGLG
jgi:osmoprotectant transport system substrate-binding protein